MRKVINDIKVYHQKIQNSPISEMRICFFAGARFDEKSGQSHFVEHAVFCGGKNFSEEEMTRRIQVMGSFVNAATTRETVTYYVQSLSENFEESAELMIDMLNEYNFPYKKIKREKGAIKREIALRNTHDSVTDDFINGHFFGEGFEDPVSGIAEDIDRMTRRDLRKFTKKYYNKQSCAISLVGDISSELADKLVKMVNLKSGEMPRMTEFNPPVVDGDGFFKVGEIDPDHETHITMRWPSHRMGHEDNHIIDLITQLMSDGYSSRLDEQLRMKHGMSYDTMMDAIKYSDRGCVDLQGNFHGDELIKAIDIINNEINIIKNEKVDEFELESARNHLLFSIKQGSMYPMLQAGDEAMSFLFNLSRPNDYIERMMSVDRDDIIRVANEIFEPNPVIYIYN